jgi:HSP20 family protein
MTQQAWREVTRPTAPMDAYRHEDHFTVHIDVPGVDPESIDLTVEKNVLTVTATRERSYAEGDEVLVAERPHGSYTRRVFLGENLDTDRIEADYHDGVLYVSIPVAEAAKPRRVEISAGGNGASTTISASSTSSGP